MRLQYLGTAAAEGVPAIFCSCETCRKARKLGGKNIRTRSQALIDGKLLIDFPADTFYHSMRDGIDLTHIHNIINTHPHEDHLYPSEVYNYMKGFAVLPEGHPKFHFWGGNEMERLLTPMTENPRMLGRVETHVFEPFVPTDIDGYIVTALPAHHGTETPFIYMIENDGKTLLYAHDTGAIKDEVWAYLEKVKPHFDLLSFDCTRGGITSEKVTGHMGLGDIKVIKEKMISLGLSDEKSTYIVNHFSHNWPDINYEDRAVYEKDGFLMSYDGMVVEV